MRTYDFSPLFRSTVGFDRLFDLAETAQRATDEGYPPYNIERLAEDRYQITLAVAGFSPDEVSITAEQNVVTIEGGKTEKAEREFLYRGISTRHFKRQFSLADYVQVKGATFDNGLLKIELVREIPEAMKPRRIAIDGPSNQGRATCGKIDLRSARSDDSADRPDRARHRRRRVRSFPCAEDRHGRRRALPESRKRGPAALRAAHHTCDDRRDAGQPAAGNPRSRRRMNPSRGCASLKRWQLQMGRGRRRLGRCWRRRAR